MQWQNDAGEIQRVAFTAVTPHPQIRAVHTLIPALVVNATSCELTVAELIFHHLPLQTD